METAFVQSSFISRTLYNIVQDVIGSEPIIELRRRKCEIIDVLNNTDTEAQYTQLVRGSRAEGFKVHSSDIDVMFVDRKTIVLSQYHLQHFINDLDGYTILAFEDSYPGFVIIECIKYCGSNEHIRRSIVQKSNKDYLSSKLYKEHVYDTIYRPRLSLHGPCVSSSYADTDFDIGFCLQCAVWPEQAISFIHRAIEACWPPKNVLIHIYRDGCLLVPINSKENIHARNNSDIEWRFSFSIAEKKIMQSLNHCQFLCYGLLKICLNDILRCDPDVRDLLCSYHMKTAMFWEICSNPENWDIDSFVCKFWDVFRRIMDWVINGYCPHFFVPQRNMFVCRMSVAEQSALESALKYLYNENVRCFLRCPSIAEMFRPTLYDPFRVGYSSVDDGAYVPSMMLELISCFQTARPVDLQSAYRELESVIRLRKRQPDFNTILTLRLHHILQSIADISLRRCTSMRNKGSYQDQRSALNILKRSHTFRLMNKIFTVQHFYRVKNFHFTIKLIEGMKSKLGPITYIWDLDKNIVHSAMESNFTFERIIRKFVLSYLSFNKENAIDELRPECDEKNETGMNKELRIPPLVFLQLLLVLSYHAVSDFMRRDEALRELRSLIFRGDSCHIHILLRAISLEILGICQQLCGHRQGARTSYLEALNDRYNDFIHATIYRIQLTTL